jgi:alcohol dehydrogenase (cytochrome c)
MTLGRSGGDNRGAAFWGNLSFPPQLSPRIVATDKETGKVVWETNVVNGQNGVRMTSAPLPIKDKLIVGASGGDGGVRDWVAALDGATGRQLWLKYTIPAPGEPGSETWKDNNNAWRTGGGAVWVTGTTIRPPTRPSGARAIRCLMDPYARPGDNLYTNSVISYEPESGKMNWFFQYTPNDGWDYDEVGTHILIDQTVAGQPRKLITHSARNGFTYTMEQANGQIVVAKPYMDGINWTKGIDQKTGKPLDYDPNRDVQVYSGVANPTKDAPVKRLCPNRTGGNNFWPTSYSQKTKLMYIPAMTACEDVTNDRELAKSRKAEGWFERSGGGYKAPERYESNLTAVDPITGEVKKNLRLKYPNYSGTLATAGGLVFIALMDGTISAMTTPRSTSCGRSKSAWLCSSADDLEVNGKQYVAIVSTERRCKSKLRTRQSCATSATDGAVRVVPESSPRRAPAGQKRGA